MVGITTWALQVINSVCQDLCIDFCKLLAHLVCHSQIPCVCTLQTPLQSSSCEIRVWALTSDPQYLGSLLLLEELMAQRRPFLVVLYCPGGGAMWSTCNDLSYLSNVVPFGLCVLSPHLCILGFSQWYLFLK